MPEKAADSCVSLEGHNELETSVTVDLVSGVAATSVM